ncbi:ParM/StbA family protein [Lederbergia lenta]|uniref:Actin-like ATPase domain-containing protein n=1 Tax=Lederbergia lenta TaxID=1467 RepID=A0A2X4WBC8_LEDLE|nr:ParM/StbA family protein [Lederbergia lenta]MCM3113460.1 ParM/StbA family protein [Lederbergia lenta]MEC2326700.1 ParM/StbA family protein [Lederbergia lenta]SQI61466.1 Actin-like ATPase domain-containing protein [Lederbergia lenta]
MDRHNFLAIDIGNSWYKAMVSDQWTDGEYQIPNAIALYDEEFFEKPYEEDDVEFEENLIVEVKSQAIFDKREIYYIGKSAARQRNVSLTAKNNQKVDEDRTYILLFGLAAYHAAQLSEEDEVHYSIDQLAVSLPTTQYKEKKDNFRQRLIGTHTVIFHKVPGIPEPKELVVKLHVQDVIIGAEGACAYLGMTRDQDTLYIKDELLVNESSKGVIIGDLGGDSVDFVGIKNNKPIASIEGETFGINPFLDNIIQKVSKSEMYKFDSRAELEEKLALGQSEWYVEPFAGVKKDISKYIIPQLKSMAIKYLEHFDRIRSSSPEIKGATRYIAVGGAAKLAQREIQEAAVSWSERGRPIDLMFPDEMEKLNVLGLMILAKMKQIQIEEKKNEAYISSNS